ncbi:protein stum homolog [Amphiura filiformis]|uniref:protein stum homolog n=1 Tax=Amphiura filiformis TaxID=82378 RepID=UPI003B21331B
MYVAKGVQSTKGVIISVREKHGSFRSAVPCMPFPMAIICCLLNIFTPGLGTFISAFTVFCCGFTETTPCKAFFWNLFAAILQAITFIFIVGWIWSISWGMTFVTLSDEYRHEKLRGKKNYKPAGSPT